jgi:hypothetical protein
MPVRARIISGVMLPPFFQEAESLNCLFLVSSDDSRMSAKFLNTEAAGRHPSLIQGDKDVVNFFDGSCFCWGYVAFWLALCGKVDTFFSLGVNVVDGGIQAFTAWPIFRSLFNNRLEDHLLFVCDPRA